MDDENSPPPTFPRSNRIDQLVDRFARWAQLRQAGNSPLMRATVVMPVVGYLLLLNESVLDFADISGRFKLIAVGVPWRLILVYYGTFALGVASLLFLLFCPSEVRKYDSPVEYIAAERDHLEGMGRVASYEDYLTRIANEMAGGVWINERMETIEQRHPQLSQMHASLSIKPGTALLHPSPDAIMTYFWYVVDLSKPKIRAWCAVFYVVGILFLAVPTGFTFLGVLSYTARLLLP